MDNAMVLQIRSGIRIIRSSLLEVVGNLMVLANKHRDTWVILLFP